MQLTKQNPAVHGGSIKAILVIQACWFLGLLLLVGLLGAVAARTGMERLDGWCVRRFNALADRVDAL